MLPRSSPLLTLLVPAPFCYHRIPSPQISQNSLTIRASSRRISPSCIPFLLSRFSLRPSFTQSTSRQSITMATVQRITDQLEKPELDDRSYRVIRLANKLEALLVHDPDTDKASAAVNVNVGNFSDDGDMPGMAHAVEHLLFMGTQKYPKENAYNQYLAAHSGSSNAYTAATETNYFFEVAATAEASDHAGTGMSTPSSSISATSNGIMNGYINSTPNRMTSSIAGGITNGITNGNTNGMINVITDRLYSSASSSTSNLVPPLYGALDRFSQFFISPLFLESTLDRELRAVDSENKKNLQSDTWRLMQLNKSLSSHEHPYHHFSTGNLQTLRDEPQKRGINVRDEFIKFHEKFYSANRMKLVVLGRESLDELEQWVVELFSGVKNKDLPQNRWDDVQPLTAAHLSTQIFAKPVMDTRSLDIYFPFLDEESLFESQPSRYISHLIGHEGPGSILAYIKAKGWANELSAGAMPICPNAAFFTISIRLTQDGLKQYHEVVKVIFQYIAMIKERSPERWIFDEMKNLAEVDFRFKQKTPATRFTSRLSSVMQKTLPREWLLSGTSLFRKFNPEAITNALSYLRADNFRIVLASQSYPGNWDSRENWYGTEYQVEKIPADFSAEIHRALESTPEERIPDLHMPHKNEFVPTRLSVEKKVLQPAKSPKLIRHDERVRLWFKKDDRFWVPKATIHVTLRNPLVWATPANYVKTKLYCDLVRDALVEYSYDAELAGLEYNLSASIFGLDVSISGYNDKMSVLLEKVVTSMRDLVVDLDRFKIVKERLARGYRNAEFQQPFYQVGDLTRYLTAEKSWINNQYATELEHIGADDVAAFFPEVLQQTHIEVLAHGNIYKEDALKMTNLVESVIRSRPLPLSQWYVRRNIIFSPGSNYIYERTLKDPENVNNCIEYYLFVGNITDNVLRAKLLLFAQMTDEPAFDQLRSREQLGYVVWSGARYSATTIGYRVIIQSERSTEYLDSRIDAFLAEFADTLDTMTEEDFEGHKRSLINRRLEKLKNLGSETSRYWSHIGSEYFDFLQHEVDATSVRALSKAEVMEFYRQYIDPLSPMRAKLSIYLNAHPAELAKKAVDLAEKKSRLASEIQTYLKDEGIVVSAEKAETTLEDVDIPSANKDEILSAVKTLLVSSMVPDDRVEPILHKGSEILELRLKDFELGSPAKATTGPGYLDHSKTNGVSVSVVAHKKSIYITNVLEFKARLGVSAGPAPITDLSEFEDLEPKL